MTRERRHSVRYPIALEVELGDDDGGRFAAHTTDVAEAGLGLMTRHEAVLALARGGTLLTPGDRLRVALPPLPEAEGAAPPLPVRVRHVRRVSQDRYQVGVGFEGLAPEQAALVAGWVERARAASPF